MQKSDIRILILEDDPTIAKVIDESLKRSGYNTQIATNYQQAKHVSKITDFHGLVADCMMPLKGGVDIAQEIIKESGHDVVVVLVSGIFKDKSFAREALLKTNAVAFLHKPFDINELVQYFDNAFSSLIDETHDPLYQLLNREQYSFKDKINAINNTEYTHGFDLPFVYSLLLDQQISGDLEIQYDELSPVTIISFNKGRIDNVKHPDSESYFGVLLIEKGFTTPAELETGLSLKSDKPIGERLVERSSISPHAIEVVQHEQMIIRLSKTIQNTSVKIKFTENKKTNANVFIDSFIMTQLLGDWLRSKITSEWLHSFYTPWLENPVLQGADYSKINLLKSMALCSSIADFFIKQDWPHNLQTVLDQNKAQEEEEVLRGLHFLLIQRAIVFGSKSTSVENFAIKLSRIQKILKNITDKNYFDVLGVSSNARTTEINRAYHELAKSLHPDKLHSQAPQDLKELTQKVFSIISDAYKTLSNDIKRKEYQKTLEIGQAEEVLKAEEKFEEAFRRLKANQFREARKGFESTMRLKGHRSDTMVYFTWALIKEKRKNHGRAELVEKVKNYLAQVAHEDRHSPSYFFVKGMHCELTGQVQKAYHYFKHSLTIDPNFIDAKREILFIKRNYSGKTKPISDDLSVVTRFFKRNVG
ncbi:MAG: hypothetical protein A2Z20_03045 [Bdellovibrionales bacterium RBG_16_40_8]|nr:MAG: hypothetical protein A2Z20_03045 [Bdellovibrionales bacterium RBG_16_40_8]